MAFLRKKLLKTNNLTNINSKIVRKIFSSYLIITENNKNKANYKK